MQTGNGCGGCLIQQLSADAVPILKEGIALVLSSWSALQMAIENEWGGRDSRSKSVQFADDIFAWFSQSKEPLYIDDLENLLDEAMLSLNAIIEDGSIEEVAEKLMIMHEECLEGNYISIKTLREVDPRARVVSHIRRVANDDSDEDESMGVDDSLNRTADVPKAVVDMSVDEPRPKAMAEADDGWTVVSSRRNMGKRN